MWHDVEIHETNEMNRALAESGDGCRHPVNRYAVVYSDGNIAYCLTEDRACEIQRDWRKQHGRDPMTGLAP